MLVASQRHLVQLAQLDELRRLVRIPGHPDGSGHLHESYCTHETRRQTHVAANTPRKERTPAIGAYGLRLAGVAGDHLQAAEPGWPLVHVTRERGRSEGDGDEVGERRALVRLRSGGEIVLEREPLRACFRTPTPLPDADLVHPFLAPAAAVLNRWLGRESLHAGAVVVGGKAWGLLGDREAGKSSLLAALALAGVPVLSDDVVVTDGAVAYAGPRTLDLRADAAAQLGVGEPLGVVGARERWRLRLPDVDPAPSLAGWVVLSWGPRVAVEPFPTEERLALLAAQRAVRVPPRDPGQLLRLVALPAVRLVRPRSWSGLRDSALRLTAALESRAPAGG